jgi:hypothetical protein
VSVFELWIVGIMQHVLLKRWILAFNIILVRFIHAVEWVALLILIAV